VPRTATDGYGGQGGPALGFLAKFAHTLCMYLLSFISKAVALGGRLPKIRGTGLVRCCQQRYFAERRQGMCNELMVGLGARNLFAGSSV
jgi:hypothetical protein